MDRCPGANDLTAPREFLATRMIESFYFSQPGDFVEIMWKEKERPRRIISRCLLNGEEKGEFDRVKGRFSQA